MRIRDVLVACALYAVHNFCQGNYDADTSIDTNYQCFNHQDIVKDFNTSKRRWLYGLSEEVDREPVKGDCVHIIKDSITDEKVNFTMYFAVKGTRYKWLKYGTFYYGLGDVLNSNNDTRPRPNSVTLRNTPGTAGGKNVSLIYSDYGNCSIYRLHKNNSAAGCIIFISDAANGSMPTFCRSMYNNSCGASNPITEFYNRSCVNFTEKGAIEVPVPVQSIV